MIIIKSYGTYLSKVSSVDERIMQHCRIGAKIEISSWNAFPNPRP